MGKKQKVDLTFENHEAIIWFCYHEVKPRLPNYTEDDWYQIGGIALIDAIDSYEKDRGMFSPYAVLLITNSWYNEIKKSERQKRAAGKSLLSLDKCLDENTGFTLGHLVRANSDPEKTLELQNKYTHIMECVVTEEHMLYIKCILQQISQEEVSMILGVSQATISKNIKHFKEDILKSYNKGGK